MDHLYNYIDDLLRLQSGAVERHNHKGVLGSIREEFVHSEIAERIDEIRGRLHKGEVYSDQEELGQHDIILRRKGVDNPTIGGHVRINVKDCAAVIEVKTNAKLTEITAFDRLSEKLKKFNPGIICGMFCYKINGKTRTVLERAGLLFDKEYQAFLRDERKVQYHCMDFLLCLDDYEESCGVDHEGEIITYSKGFFLKREKEYVLHHSPPYSKLLFSELRRSDAIYD